MLNFVSEVQEFRVSWQIAWPFWSQRVEFDFVSLQAESEI